MVWAKIPPEKLEHASLFGYDLIEEGDKYNSYYNPQGKITFVEKAAPKLWFEDIGEAIQMGSEGIYSVSKSNPPEDNNED